MTITATGRFLPTDGLSLPFSRIKAQPWRALRLVACDVAVIGGASVTMGLVLPEGQFEGAVEPASAVGVFALLTYFLWTLISLAAWMRFLADRGRPGPLPHRLGADEVRLLGVYVVAMLIAMPLIVIAALPAFVINLAGANVQAGLWAILILGALAWFFARFAPIPARVVLSGRFEPFCFWEETRPMAGRLRWALVCLGVIYVFGALIAALPAGIAIGDYRVVVGQFDMGANELIRDTISQTAAFPVWLGAATALTVSWLCRLMLRGVAVQAALVIEFGGEEAAEADMAVPGGGAPAPVRG
jgi:hypothetical protein